LNTYLGPPGLRFIAVAQGKNVYDLTEEILQEGIAKRKHVVQRAASPASSEF